MRKIKLPQIDEDTRQAINKIHYSASSKAISSLVSKGVTPNCKVRLIEINRGCAFFEVNGERVRANFTTKSEREHLLRVRGRWKLNNSVDNYIDELNKQLILRNKLQDNLIKAKKKRNTV